jgi:hypothetical protein
VSRRAGLRTDIRPQPQRLKEQYRLRQDLEQRHSKNHKLNRGQPVSALWER